MALSSGYILLLPCALIVVPVLTWAITSYRFQRQIFSSGSTNKKEDDKLALTVPYRTPLIGDAILPILNPEKYVSGVFTSYGWRRPLRVRAGSRFFTLVSNPEHIVAIFKAPKQAGAKSSTSMALRRLFGASEKAAEYYDADDSGTALQPRKGSNVPAQNRVHFWTANTAQTFLSGTHLQELNERFISTLNYQLNAKGIQDQWVEYPDLYAFVQSLVGRSATETLMGPRLLEMSPGLLNDFRIFDNNIMSAAHKKAAANVGKTAAEDPEFHAYFGSKLIRARQSAMMKMDLDSHDRATLDVGLMFAVNSNVLRAIFWFIIHALQDADLQFDLLAEAHKCQRPDGIFDVATLCQQPLLQSTFAEVCRFYVAIDVSRTVNYSNLKLGQWTIPVGETLSIFNREAAFNDEAWTAAGRRQETPLAVFDAKRFLVAQDTDRASEKSSSSFSLEGLAGCWLPFGGGQQMCPGRHFAKSEMLGSFAMLLTKYDLELTERAGEVRPDMRWYPTGTLPPKAQVPFRIRRKPAAQV